MKPREPAHGRILCNREELTAGARCILECEAGYLAQAGELAVCQAGGRWAPLHRKLACVRPIAMLIGGFNAEEVGIFGNYFLEHGCKNYAAKECLMRIYFRAVSTCKDSSFVFALNAKVFGVIVNYYFL